MKYGYSGTIHKSRDLDVEIGPDGKVVSIWFRCMALNFNETVVGKDRAEEMREMYRRGNVPDLLGIEVSD